MIHSLAQPTLEIFMIVMTFLGPGGDRHLERMSFAFTDEVRCEEFAREVLKNHYERIPGLYWWCESVPVNQKP
jgi:hypothetical protein